MFCTSCINDAFPVLVCELLQNSLLEIDWAVHYFFLHILCFIVGVGVILQQVEKNSGEGLMAKHTQMHWAFPVQRAFLSLSNEKHPCNEAPLKYYWPITAINKPVPTCAILSAQETSE